MLVRVAGWRFYPTRGKMRGTAQERLRRVEGRHNALVKELRWAFDRGELTETGACAIDGTRIVEEAIRSSLRFESIFFSESAQNIAEKLLPQIGAQVETLLLPDKLFSSAVPSESPQGVAALVRPKTSALKDIMEASAVGPILVLAGIQDPGNLGTILRSAEAFGAAGVLLAEKTVSPFNAKVIRGSAGSLFRLPVVRIKLLETISQLTEAGVRIVATSSHKGTVLHQAKLIPPIAVFIGSEGAGLPRDVIAKMDEVLAIPHAEQVESLNAGVAASIVLYETARQKL